VESSVKKKKNHSLVYYRLPDEKKTWLLQSKSVIEIDSLKKIPEKPGFILYPFSLDGSCKPLFIQADEHAAISQENIYAAITDKDATWELKTLSTSHSFSKSREEYCKKRCCCSSIYQFWRITKGSIVTDKKDKHFCKSLKGIL